MNSDDNQFLRQRQSIPRWNQCVARCGGSPSGDCWEARTSRLHHQPGDWPAELRRSPPMAWRATDQPNSAHVNTYQLHIDQLRFPATPARSARACRWKVPADLR